VTTGLQPPEGTAALLFDCDGTLVDTLGLYRECWREVFGQRGFEMTDAWFTAWAGHSLEPFIAAAFPGLGAQDREEIGTRGLALFRESTHLLEPLEHVVSIARQYAGVLPMAVVSGGPRVAVLETLEAVGIGDLFDTIVTVDDVERGKPEPDAYQLAMERLGVNPEQCVAYEDTAIGIASAAAAGIRVVVDVGLHAPLPA
jgi:beta-phosphoglucomutase-like phosphatase (HAD superfamily)